MSDTNIGFIGLGNVGSKIANNIINNGYKLYIHDLDEKKSQNLVSKGAIFCKSIEELIPKVTVLITCLPSPKSVKEVLLKSLPKLNQTHLWIEMSTTDEKEMR
ncbi:MAG: NAD(P)-binding domain-containing protein, partial [Alphaproteobacteria bacterium]|nr:NAD(P)-binding domain-containing protein [Alphaproteobacteria bacterium]